MITLASHRRPVTSWQILATSISPETSWLIKNCLASFPKDIQANLTSALRKE